MAKTEFARKTQERLAPAASEGIPTSRWGPAIRTSGVVLGMVALLLAALYIYFGSVGYALVYLSGHRLALTPAEITLSDGHLGDVKKARVTVANLSGDAVAILGYKSSCDCTAVDDLPVRIAAGGRAEMDVLTDMEGYPGAFRHNVVLNTDYADAPFLRFTVAGRIVK